MTNEELKLLANLMLYMEKKDIQFKSNGWPVSTAIVFSEFLLSEVSK